MGVDFENSTLKKKQIDFLDILEKNAGMVQSTCKKINIDRQTYYNWLKNNEEFATRVEDIYEGLLDFGESQLFKLMKEGNPAAIFFFLKCKGKKRGYIETQKIEHSGEIDTNITFVPARKE